MITDIVKAAAINTVSGVNMTTRRHMLKIKVYAGLVNPCRGLIQALLQGMSEAKVEKIKAGILLST